MIYLLSIKNFKALVPLQLGVTKKKKKKRKKKKKKSVTVLQFPTEEEPGVKIIRPSYERLSEEERLVDLSVLDSFTEVVDGNYSIKNAICPIQTINIPEKLTKDVTESFNVGLKEEMG